MSQYYNNGTQVKKTKAVELDTTKWWKDAIFGNTPGAKTVKKAKAKKTKALKKTY